MDYIHLNEQGNGVIARAIYDHLSCSNERTDTLAGQAHIQTSLDVAV